MPLLFFILYGLRSTILVKEQIPFPCKEMAQARRNYRNGCLQCFLFRTPCLLSGLLLFLSSFSLSLMGPQGFQLASEKGDFWQGVLSSRHSIHLQFNMQSKTEAQVNTGIVHKLIQISRFKQSWVKSWHSRGWDP